MLKFEMSFTKSEVIVLKRRYTKKIGGYETFKYSGNFRDQYGEKLEFPDQSIMQYVVEKASSEPLSEEELQRLILDARIFFRKEELRNIEDSLRLYEELLTRDPEDKTYIWNVEYMQKEQIPQVAMQLAKLESEAKAAAEAAEAAKAAKAADTAEADVSD